MRDVFILEGARTPFALWSGEDRRPCGKLSDTDPFDLAGLALKEAIRRADLTPEDIELLVFGNMYQVGTHACYGGRYAGHRAGIPAHIPAVTVNIACGTGLLALAEAAHALRRNEASFAAAAGADCPSMVSRKIFIPSFNDISCGRWIGQATEELAKKFSITRLEQDQWALASHTRASQAKSQGLLAQEIVPAGIVGEDDGILHSLDIDFFQEAEAIYGKGGLVTHANAHAIVDGGSALILASAPKTGRPALGRYIGHSLAAVEPERMGWASVPAIRNLLKRAALKQDDIDLYELNETFAAQVLVDMKELGLAADKVNVNGGAIALGHPFAATGGRQVLTLLYEMRRRNLKRGIASICIGGGQAIAVLVER